MEGLIDVEYVVKIVRVVDVILRWIVCLWVIFCERGYGRLLIELIIL